MKQLLFLCTALLFLLFLLPLNTGSAYTQVLLSSPGNANDSLDPGFEKIVQTLRRTNTENISLLGARKYKTGYRRALIALDSLKKSGRYQELYDSLSAYFQYSPASFIYYEELIKAGSASGNLLLLKNRLDNIRPLLISEYELYARAVILNLRGNIDSSLSIIKDIYSNNRNNPAVFLQYANSLREKGEYSEAMRLIEANQNIYSSNPHVLGDILILRGNISFVRGNYPRAEAYYKQAAEIAAPVYDLYTVAKSGINTGLVLDMYGDIDNARSAMEEGIRISKEIREPELTAYGYSELGVSWSFTADYMEALDYYNKSIDIYTKLGNQIRLAYLYSNKGNIQNILGNYGGAIKTYEAGLESAGDAVRAVIQNLTGLADSYNNLANYTAALQYYNEATQLANKIDDKDLLSHIELGIGSFKINIGAYPSAVQNLETALNFNRQSGNKSLNAEIKDKLALAYAGMGQYSAALSLLDEANKEAAAVNDNYLRVLIALHTAEILGETEEYEKAFALLGRIRPLMQQPGYENILTESYLLEADLSLKGEILEQAATALESIREQILSGTNFRFRITFFSLAGTVASGMNKLQEAAESYESAIAEFNKTSHSLIDRDGSLTSLSAQDGLLFDKAINVYINLGDFNRAFELIEQSAGKSAYKNVSSLILSGYTANAGLLDRLYGLDWNIQSGYYSKTETDSMRSAFDSLAQSAGLQNHLFRRNLSLFEIQKQLQDDEYIYTIHMTEDSAYIFLVSATDLKITRRKGGKTSLSRIKKAVSPQYDNRIGTPDFVNKDLFAFDALAASYLYKFLFEEAAAHIPQGARIVVLPDEFLKNFPLEILVAGFSSNTGSFNYDECEFLGSKYRFAYTPGYSVYHALSSLKSSGSKQSLLIGNPFMSAGSKLFAQRRGLMKDKPDAKESVMLPLRFSLSEVNNIDNMLDFATVLSGSFATESRFKELASTASLIHLSTHSVLYRNQPVIFFSNLYDAANDGFLEAGEIASLNLSADLVVLSSCGSGLGTSSANEGVVGFNKALLEGGAKSVVSTLWEIDDKYTAAFMALFYHQLSVGVSKSEALRRAKDEFIKTIDPNPYYWGAFVLYGSDSQMHIEKKNYVFIVMQYISLGFVFMFILLIYFRRLTRKKVTPL